MHRYIRNHYVFCQKCLTLLASVGMIFWCFIILAIIGAMMEGISISLLAPLLQSNGNMGFENIPVLGKIVAQFGDYSANERVKLIAITMAIVLLARGVIQYGISALGYIIPLRLQKEMVVDNYRLMMNIRISYLNDHDYGNLYNDINGWPLLVSVLLTDFAVILYSMLVMLFYVMMMMLISWQFSLLTLLFMIFMVLMLKALSSGPLYRAGVRLNTTQAQLDQMIMESVTGMKLIRLSAAEMMMTNKFVNILSYAIEAKRHKGLMVSLSAPLMELFSGIFICLLLFISAVMHGNDNLEWVGSILIFMFLMFRLVGPVSQIDGARSRINSHMPAFERLDQFRQVAREQRQPNGTHTIEKLQHDIVLENVSFAYKAGSKRVLDNVSTTIAQGQMTAVVGPSGAGKSTLISLITRLYDPQSGRILVGGHDLNDLNVHSWRRRLAVVSQDIFIFNDTVAYNIRFGLGDVSMERVHQAVKLAAADEFVESLPEGYDTLLGDRGMRLSGGQRQRISIARAILANPDLLIMDEATSHLDTFTERAIQQALDQFSRNRTLLVIAHRLSTIRRADKVIVINDGQIVEEGRHDELLRRRGIYWEMVEHQRIDLVDENAGDDPIEGEHR